MFRLTSSRAVNVERSKLVRELLDTSSFFNLVTSPKVIFVNFAPVAINSSNCVLLLISKSYIKRYPISKDFSFVFCDTSMLIIFVFSITNSSRLVNAVISNDPIELSEILSVFSAPKSSIPVKSEIPLPIIVKEVIFSINAVGTCPSPEISS